MSADELLDDEALDPKELFDSAKYSTLIINRDGFTKKQNETADLIEKLLEKEIEREELDEVYKDLKAIGNIDMMIEAINNTRSNQQKAKLISAIWESGLEAQKYFLLFTKLSCDEDFSVAMEALTVIENIESKIETKILTSAMELAQENKSPNTELINDLINCIKQKAVQPNE